MCTFVDKSQKCLHLLSILNSRISSKKLNARNDYILGREHYSMVGNTM
jgi:hypothetical protein